MRSAADRSFLDSEEERSRAVKDLQALALRLAAVAELGRRALAFGDADALIADAVSLTVQVLGLEYCEVLELLPAGDALALRAGHGWRKGLVGEWIVEANQTSQAGHALLVQEPVIVSDLAAEARFRPSRLLLEHGIVSGIEVVIRMGGSAFGLLGAWTTGRRPFSAEDARFLEAIAHVLGSALERERALAAQRRSEARFRALIENSSDAIALLDREGTILYAGPSTRRILGYSEEEFVGKNAYALIHPADLERTRKALDRLRGNPGGSVTSEYRFRHKDGTWRWVESVTTNLLHDPGVLAVVNNYRDITERRRRERRMRHQAEHDPLTDLPNRTLFGDRLVQSLARAHRSGRAAAVVFGDLDRFKRVNDELGHAAGDRLLQAVAGRLKACLREDDTVGRMGGDEFTMILQDLAKPEDAALVARKILDAVARPVDLGGSPLTVTTSLGISLYPRDGETPEILLSKADDALYRAKTLGRNTYRLASEA